MPDLFDILINLDDYLGLVIQQLGLWTYLVLFLIVFVETGLVVAPFLPSDALLFVAGALSALGDLNLAGCLVLFVTAAVLGDALNYRIGRLIGPRITRGEIALIKPEHLAQTRTFYARYGLQTIMYARWVPMLRTLAPLVAGMGAMTYRAFIRYNVPAVLIWVLVNMGLGYFFGNIPAVQDNFSLVVLAIFCLSLLPAVIDFWRERRGGQQPG